MPLGCDQTGACGMDCRVKPGNDEFGLDVLAFDLALERLNALARIIQERIDG